MANMNFVNRTLWTGDNLDILRGMNSDTIDLIYLDPPFNSNRNYQAPVGSKAAGAAFKDAWTLSDLDVAWTGLIAEERPAIAHLLDTTGRAHGRSMQSYLTMMAVRLLEKGQYRTGDLTGAGTSEGESGIPWRGFDPGSIGRHWAVPKTGKYTKYLDSILLPGYLNVPGVHDRLDTLDKAGMIHYSSTGGMPALKRYLPPDAGQIPGDIWTDIDVVNSRAKERVGYPTQKPLALLERIIAASSNEGDVVLDPFCGCATACVAAEKMGRQWVGIDLSEMAYTLVRERVAKEVQVGSEEFPRLTGWEITHRTDIPRRTDIDAPKNYRKNKHVLFGQQESKCAGCRMDFPFKIFEVDHIIPQSRGGTDHMDNLQLLCGHCDRIKGDRPQEYLMTQLRDIVV